MEDAALMVSGRQERSGAIPPDAKRLFARRMGATVVEIESSHVVMVSHPETVYNLIVEAAKAVQVTLIR